MFLYTTRKRPTGSPLFFLLDETSFECRVLKWLVENWSDTNNVLKRLLKNVQVTTEVRIEDNITFTHSLVELQWSIRVKNVYV